MTSTVNCNCTARGDFPKRSARSGVVLHEHRTGGIVILVNAKAPRKWRAVIGSAEGWRVGTFDISHAPAYHQAIGGVLFSLPEPALPAFEEMLGGGDGYALAAHARAKAQWMIRASKIESAFDDLFTTAPPDVKEKAERLAEALKKAKVTPKDTTGYVPRAKAAPKSADTFAPPPPNPDRYWYEAEGDARLFQDFVATRLAGHDTNMIVVGPSGFGKTESVTRLGERLGVPTHVVNCQAITTPEKWLGQMSVDPDRGTFFDVSEHLQWVERTHKDCEGAEYCIIVYDEITRLRSELGNMLFSLLDGQRGLEVPQMNRTVPMSDRNVIFATANIGSAYAGTFQMDWALRGRFDTTLERHFPPTDEEVKVIMTANDGKLEEKAARDMIRVAEHTRVLWKNGELEFPISTRLLLSWARYVAGGYTIKDAAEYTIIPVYSEDGGADSDRAKVKLAIDGKVG